MILSSRKWSLLTIFILSAFIFISCNPKNHNQENSSVKNNNSGKKINQNVVESQVETDLENASKKAQTVFLIIDGAGSSGTDYVSDIVNQAVKKIPESKIIHLNKDDESNANIVGKFGISNVPVPFVIVVSPKGFPVNGFTAQQLSLQNLIDAVPTPKQDEVYLALSQKTPVYIVVSKNNMDKMDVVKNCSDASSSMVTKPPVIEFDFNDDKEQSFLSRLGVTSINNKSVIVVINSAGQVTEKFEGKTDVAKLIAAANKIIQSSCCPSGSSKSCN